MNSTSTIIQALPNQYEVLLNNYVAIVEKTNQQLGLWTNPYGLMIGLLTIIIAVVAIAVSLLLWKHSAEQKKAAKEFFDRLEKDFKNRSEKYDMLLIERSEKVKNYEESLSNLIQEYKNKLTNVNKENKEEITRLEKAIDDLNKSKASLGLYAIPEAEVDMGFNYTNLGYNSIHTRICFGCSKKFQYRDKYKDNYDAMSITTSAFMNNKKVYCPHCGAENFV